MEAYKIYFKVITENRGNRSLEWLVLSDYSRFDFTSERNKILSNFLDELERKFPNRNFAKIWIKTDFDGKEFIFLFTDADIRELHGFGKTYIFDYNHKRPEIIELRIEHICTVDDNSEIPLDKGSYGAATLYRSGPDSKTLFSNKRYWISTARSYI